MELRDAFLAELDDIVPSVTSTFAHWRSNTTDLAALKALRRGFHTIKGSAPLVGAESLGEFCKDLERLVIELHDRPTKITPITISTLAQAIELLAPFADSVRHNRAVPMLAASIGQRVRRLGGPG